MSGKFWREAASLILISSNGSSLKTFMDYRVLMGIRNAKSTFMANAFVFPGGALAPSVDLNPKWIDLFKKYSNQDPSALVLDPSKVDRPFLISRPGPNEGIPRDIAFRIAALRETFEETGIFLNTTNKNRPVTLDNATLFNWRKRVIEDPEAFIVMCSQLEASPDIWSLNEWSCWLTPLGLPSSHPSGAKRRYDTIFYIAFVNENDYSLAEGDDEEMFSLKWKSPLEILEDTQEQKDAWLAPPQLYELARLLNFQKEKSLKEFSIRRSKLGCISTFPVRACLPKDQGWFAFLPGDDYYPDDANPEQTEEEYEGYTLDHEYMEVMKYSYFINRIFIGPNKLRLPFVNIRDPHGHLKPKKIGDYVIK